MSFTASLYSRIFKVWRARRFELFLRLMRPEPSDLLLDLGGFPGFWLANPQPVKRIDSLNMESVSWNNDDPNHNIRTLVGDGCALPMPDKSYDIAFSNSVIEHVGCWERQQQFAAEMRRVGNGVWLQTPAWEFPFEPHFLAFFVQYLPWPIRKVVCRWLTPRAWMDFPVAKGLTEHEHDVRLLSRREVQRLFPDCEVLVERFWGMPKSYIAFRPKPAR